MKSLYAGLTAFILTTAATGAQVPRVEPLSIDQQIKISEIVTNRTPQPLTHVNFPVSIGTIIPQDVALRPLPPDAEAVAPQLHGASYLAIEELVAIVDGHSRKIVSVMQRMRRQESTGSAR